MSSRLQKKKEIKKEKKPKRSRWHVLNGNKSEDNFCCVPLKDCLPRERWLRKSEGERNKFTLEPIFFQVLSAFLVFFVSFTKGLVWSSASLSFVCAFVFPKPYLFLSFFQVINPTYNEPQCDEDALVVVLVAFLLVMPTVLGQWWSLIRRVFYDVINGGAQINTGPTAFCARQNIPLFWRL